MKIIDMHCDTITVLQKKGSQGECITLEKNHLHVDLEKLVKGNYMLQNFAIFTHLKKCKDINQHLTDCIQLFKKEMKCNDSIIKQIFCYNDILENVNFGVISSMLTLEEGDVINDISDLELLYDMGVRMIAPVWNFENRIATPAVVNHQSGITEFGKLYILKMVELGVIIDVSHLNDQGIEDILSMVDVPIVASHSNARTVTNVPRNLSDKLIRKISNNGGVIGINFYGLFLGDSTIENVVKHVRYISKVGGIDVVAIGSDFDGIDGVLELQDASYMPLLINALLESGFTLEEVEKICYKNVLRVYREVLK